MRSRLVTVLLVCVAVVAVSGCGSGQSSSTTTVAIGPGATGPTTASPAAPRAHPAKRRGGYSRLAEARIRAAMRAQQRTHFKHIATPAGTPRPTSLAGVSSPKNSPVPKCMADNGVLGAHQVGRGSWLGQVRAGQQLRVTGPYPHPNSAEVAARTLTLGGVGEVGGRYIVSARIDGKLGPLINKVALCLQNRGGVGSGKGGLTF